MRTRQELRPPVLSEARASGVGQHRLWAFLACRETRFDFPPTHQHQGETAIGDMLRWALFTSSRTYDGTVHVWVHPSVVGNSFWRPIVCRLILDVPAWSAGWSNGMGTGADQRGHSRAGLLSARFHADLASGTSPHLRAELWALPQAIILSEPGATFISDCAAVLRGLAWPEVVLSGAKTAC